LLTPDSGQARGADLVASADGRISEIGKGLSPEPGATCVIAKARHMADRLGERAAAL